MQKCKLPRGVAGSATQCELADAVNFGRATRLRSSRMHVSPCRFRFNAE